MLCKPLTPALVALVLAAPTYALDTHTTGVAISDADTGTADLFVNDTTVLDGFVCIGTGCVSTEISGGETAKLKNSNVHLLFDDASNPAGTFPSNDWMLLINDSSSGGLDRFSIQDVTGGTIPFTVENSAPSNSFWIEGSGEVGFGTSLPQADLHIVDDFSPQIRFEELDGAPYIWNLGGNDAAFFFQDYTAGTSPLVMKSGTPSNTIYTQASGNIGLGTNTPTDALHLVRDDGTAVFRVEDTGVSTGNLTMMHLVNASGRARMQFSSTGSVNQTGDWSISSGKTFVLQDRSDSQNVLIVDQDGNVAITGQLTTAGSCSIGCDRVFDEGYDLLSLKEHTDQMWENGYLPNVGPTPADGTFNVSDKMGRMLNELEHAHIYIDQLHDQLNETKAQQRERDTAQMALIDELMTRLIVLEGQQ